MSKTFRMFLAVGSYLTILRIDYIVAEKHSAFLIEITEGGI